MLGCECKAVVRVKRNCYWISAEKKKKVWAGWSDRPKRIGRGTITKDECY